MDHDIDTYPRLLGDIGGTNARFAMALHRGAPLQAVSSYRCEEFASLGQAMQHYLAERAPAPPQACALGVATAVTGDEIRFTNSPWSFSTEALRRQLGLQRLLVINDFTALALSLPTLAAHERHQVGGGVAVAGAPVALIGPGTGLGVSGLLPMPGGGEVPIGGEGGHVTLAGADAEEAAVVQRLQARFGHASAERALSGPGLENLLLALSEVCGQPPRALAAAAITEAALAGTDAMCVKVLTMFCSLLGSVAGNLALTLGARGGVYIGGGIVPRLGDWFDASPFRERFEAKGRFATYLQAVPSWVVQAEVNPALAGALRALDLMAPQPLAMTA